MAICHYPRLQWNSTTKQVKGELMSKWRKATVVTALLAVFLFTSSGLSWGAERPDAGKTLDGLHDKVPPIKEGHADVDVGEQKRPAEGGDVRIHVVDFRITGQDVYSDKELLQLVANLKDRQLTFGDIQLAADRITKYFREHGYLVAQAYIPAQDVKDGVVEIAVTVGRYGKITIENKSSLKQAAVTKLFSRVHSGEYITNKVLERALLLLNDTSGITGKAVLRPGAEPGTSDLVVEVKDSIKTSGRLYADNYGNRFTGKIRTGASYGVNNVSGRGDTLSFGGILAGSGMDEVNFSYLTPVGRDGMMFGVSASRMHYSLGEDFAALDANGTARTFSVFGSYSFIRTHDFTLSGRLAYERKVLQDRIDSQHEVTDKHTGNWTASVDAQKVGPGSVTTASLSVTRGHLGIDTPGSRANDDATAQTAGSFTKGNIIVYHGRALNTRLSMSMSFIGQKASKNLDSSERLSAGGINGVRAYPQGEASGDEGYIFTGELRWNLPTSRFQFAGFFDTARITTNRHLWAGAPPTNSRLLSGVGVGLLWNTQNDWTFRLDYAWRLTGESTSDTDRHGRFWMKGTKYF